MPPVISMEHLTKRYGNTVAVDNVSFTVQEGEIFGVIGPNGAGKSTTGECLQGMRVPDGGTMQVLGRDPATPGDQLRRRIGSQFQPSTLPDRAPESYGILGRYQPLYIAASRIGLIACLSSAAFRRRPV